MHDDPWLERLYRYFRENPASSSPIPHPSRPDSRGSAAGRQWRQAAVLIPVVRPAGRGQESRVILTLRTRQMRSHAGQVALPGGTCDADDHGPMHTALRESHEEINLIPEEVEIIGRMGKLWLPSGYQVTPIVGLIDPGASLHPEPAEVAAIFQAPAALVLSPDSYRETDYEVAGRRMKTLELYHDGYRIWGATAAILHHLGRELTR